MSIALDAQVVVQTLQQFLNSSVELPINEWVALQAHPSEMLTLPQPQ